jgi:type II secretory pathway component GspD/PulD (secretin)
LTWDLLEGAPGLLRVTRDPAHPDRWTALAAGGHGERERKALYALESPVTLELQDADVHRVFGAVASLLQSRLLIDVALAEESITIHHEERPIADFLDDVCDEIGCAWSFDPGENPLLSVEARP